MKPDNPQAFPPNKIIQRRVIMALVVIISSIPLTAIFYTTGYDQGRMANLSPWPYIEIKGNLNLGKMTGNVNINDPVVIAKAADHVESCLEPVCYAKER